MTDAPTDPSSAHIVDQLIEERAVKLRAGPLWSLVRAIFYPLLGYGRAVEVADQLAGRPGPGAMDWSEAFLSMPVNVQGLAHVPQTGPCVITANHPGGIADGIALWSALKARRPDMVFFANRDAIRVCAGLSDLVIPVEWRAGARSRDKTRETLRQSVEAFRAGRCVVIFPAGRMARWDWRAFRLVEQDWAPTAVSLARKFAAPVIPLGMKQRMSVMFYALGQIHEELKHMTVFHELLAKRGARYRLTFAPPVAPEDLPGDDAAASEALRAMTETLARDAR
ncbi:MAG: 1-acyl-sn-glycerol-3-phosphate acyltransferase [Alphaproteobacteria bacterium]|nr:1-acyl-sn-glycerol-3-phosphate acyltransferase [Alphaproteobacteria bacterium]